MLSSDDVLDLVAGFRIARAITAAAELGLAEQLTDGPLAGKDIAERAQTDPMATTLLLRALASRQILNEPEPDVFALNEAGVVLLPQRLGGAKEMVLGWVGSPLTWASLGELAQSVRTGRPGSELAFGRGFFAELCADPQSLDHYQASVGGEDAEEFASLLDIIDLSDATHIADLGGGGGGLVRGAVTKWPHLRGTVIDLPQVVQRTKRLVAADGVQDRISVVAADIAIEIPPGPDCYVMTTVLRYFNDSSASDILSRTRSALPTGGRLILVEMPLPPGTAAAPSALKSLIEYALSGGRDRTLDEITNLLTSAGFVSVHAREWQDPYWVIEATS